MNDILFTIIGVVITGIVVLLCLSCCILASRSDAYWEEVRKELDKNDRQ